VLLIFIIVLLIRIMLLTFITKILAAWLGIEFSGQLVLLCGLMIFIDAFIDGMAGALTEKMK